MIQRLNSLSSSHRSQPARTGNPTSAVNIRPCFDARTLRRIRQRVSGMEHTKPLVASATNDFDLGDAKAPAEQQATQEEVVPRDDDVSFNF